MTDSQDPIFLSTIRLDAVRFAGHPEVAADAAGARILRSVLMKPEFETHVEHLHQRLEELARS
jgi:hypothetical protein